MAPHEHLGSGSVPPPVRSNEERAEVARLQQESRAIIERMRETVKKTKEVFNRDR